MNDYLKPLVWSRPGMPYENWIRRGGGILAFILCASILAAVNLQAQENVKRTADGLLVQFKTAEVELAAVGQDALCLSVIHDHQARPASTFLAPGERKLAPWRKLQRDGWVGIKGATGSLLINPADGEWTLEDAEGKVIIPKHELGDLNHAMGDANSEVKIKAGWQQGMPIKVYGCGNGVDQLEQTKAKAGVSNGRATLPYYWSKAGYAVLAVTPDDNHPARWSGAESGDFVTWTFAGKRADLYLMPAATLKAAATAYAHLTGASPVPPLWSFGYLQSRWGWTNRAYIEDTLRKFHEYKVPVDAFIYDFEWYTTAADYSVPDEGRDGFEDFTSNPILFPDLKGQIKDYDAQGVRFVGIRKPRLGNSDLLKMARAKSWDLQSQSAKKVSARDLDFANPEVREWYIKQSANLFKSGAAGWWNDEGESSYTTYYYWNLAERMALDRYRPNERLWTLNRAFSPGDHRLGAAAWTGDITCSWDVLASTPAQMLNWSLAGMPYGACDIGGFFGNASPELMCRWMAAGVFFPIMRTHSEVHFEPHFPWLYGDEALTNLRALIDLRYRLVPFYYSLAHETYATGLPLMRPLVMEYPNDPAVAGLTDEWLMGDSLLAAPILREGGKRSVYLPAGNWFVFGTNQMVGGGATISVTASLSEVPAYVRAGTILPLGPVVQHTSELPGGPLELQVYPGTDATFTFVEDDGESQDYQKSKVRRTMFHWDDAKKELSWQRKGGYSGKNVFRAAHIVVLDPNGRQQGDLKLGRSGAWKQKDE